MSFNLEAADLYCEGAIDNVRVTQYGSVYFEAGWTPNEISPKVCDLGASYNNVTSETCKFWTSSLQTALYTRNYVKFRFAQSEYTDCATIPHGGSAPQIHSIYFLNTQS